MQKHSKSKGSRQPRSRPTSIDFSAQHSNTEPCGFLRAFLYLVKPHQWRFIEQALGTRRGPKAEVPLSALLVGLVYHFFSNRGTLGEHMRQLLGIDYSDGSASERRQALPWEVFARLMRVVLRPFAEPKKHPEAFFQGWRLMAIDGVWFSLNNAPAIKKTGSKAKSRRGRAAFTKMAAAVLLELGTHNPVAATIGRKSESEWSLALRLLSQLGAGCLVIADRLYGRAAFVSRLLDRCTEVGSEFLVRVEKRLKSRVIKTLKDGSRIIEVDVRDKEDSHRIARTLQLREIRVTVRRPGFKAQELRLWTSILDWRKAPAMELAKLYAQRWEEELYFRHLKSELRRSERLQSGTLETAAQEIAAWIISSALIARERAKAAKGQLPVLRVSFMKLVELLRPLWLVLSIGSDLLSAEQQRQLTDRFLKEAGRCVTPKRRTRSCPRALRQPIQKWPRLQRNKYWNDPVELTLVASAS